MSDDPWAEYDQEDACGLIESIPSTTENELTLRRGFSYSMMQ